MTCLALAAGMLCSMFTYTACWIVISQTENLSPSVSNPIGADDSVDSAGLMDSSLIHLNSSTVVTAMVYGFPLKP
jgi:hypothetical protein